MENRTILNKSIIESEIIEVDHAIESFRDSGFDLSTASGEVIDNAQEAKARQIKIKTFGEKDINEMVFVDDGVGIPKEIMSQVLKLGFSSRYNSREGLGRFGVGLKLASISVARRVDIYSINIGESEVYHSYLDLDMISSKEQKTIKTEVLFEIPNKYKELFTDRDNKLFQSGTIVIWSKIDRLKDGGKYGNSNKQKISELREFIARTYRRYIDNGLKIELNGTDIELSDPTFQLYSNRTAAILGENCLGEIIEENSIAIDNKKVNYIVTISPEIMRRFKGDGGIRGAAAKYKELHIDRNARKVSILRNGREIYYDIIPRLLVGSDTDHDIDRFIGIEISFDAELDEYFQVRNVKRGAQPVDKLYKELREKLKKPVIEAKKRIKSTWTKYSDEMVKDSENHKESTSAIKEAEITAPKGRAGLDISKEEIDEIFNNILEDQGLNREKNNEEFEKKKKELKQLPISISDAGWNGKELFEIHHLNGTAHVVLNKRHPFFKDVYYPMKNISGNTSDSISTDDIIYYSRLITSAIDVLIMAYAKAENMVENPEELYSDLRTYWGINTSGYIRSLLKEVK